LSIHCFLAKLTFMMQSFVLAAAIWTVHSFRVDHLNERQQDGGCDCSENGVVNGKDTGKPGCAMHFGQRLRHICYINGGAECPGAVFSKRTEIWWRPCPVEKKRQDAKAVLLKAMVRIDLDALNEALAKARLSDVDEATLEEGEQQILQVKLMLKVKDELLQAVRGTDSRALLAALERCEETELDAHLPSSTLEEAVVRLSFLEKREEETAELQSAIAGHDLVYLEDKLKSAGDAQVESKFLQAAKVRVVELKDEIEAAVKEFETCMKGDDPAKLRHATQAVKRLKVLTDEGKAEARLTHLHAHGHLLSKAAERLLHLELRAAAKEDLLVAEKQHLLRVFQEAYSKAATLKVDEPTLRDARKREAEIRASMKQAKAELETQIAGRRSVELQEALHHAVRLETVDSALVKKAEARLVVLREMDAAARALLKAAEGDKMGDLIRALKSAKQLDVDQHVLHQGDLAMTRIRKMMHVAKNNMKGLVEEGSDTVALRAAIAECKRISAVSTKRIRAAEAKLAELER